MELRHRLQVRGHADLERDAPVRDEFDQLIDVALGILGPDSVGLVDPGAVADAIGARLALLAENTQVLVVTHLPQVAARGNHHLFISKASAKGQTQTGIAVLTDADRKEELARMLAGAEVTDEARGAAEKLLEVVG